MFRGMEYVYEVYKEKSFSKAAQNLYISQPSLSATIRKIEQRIGAPIFDRSSVPIRLTECGKEYVKYMEKIMDLERDFSNYITNLNGLKTGNIAIGGSNFFTSFILPPIISKFTKKYPCVSIKLIEANTASLEKYLFEGMLDFVIDNVQFNPNTYSEHYLYKEHLILAVNKKFASNNSVKSYQLSTEDIISGKHLDNSTKAVPLKSFQNDPFLLLRLGNDTRISAEKACISQGFTPNTILKLDQQITAYNLACYGMGITFISDTLVQYVKSDNNMIYYKIDFDGSQRNVCFYQKREKYTTRAMEEFLKIASAIDF